MLYNGQKKNYKTTKKHVQNITQKAIYIITKIAGIQQEQCHGVKQYENLIRKQNGTIYCVQ